MNGRKQTLEYAQKLVRYFEEHMGDQPEWEAALFLARDWCLVLRTAEVAPQETSQLRKKLEQLSVPEGSAVEELRMMMNVWLRHHE